MSRSAEARRLALADPELTQAEIARVIGMSREGVRQALSRDGIAVRDGRSVGGQYRRQREFANLADARRKMQANEPLTRAERHLLWEDYRRRERGSVA